jgi:hypothetical protein
MANPATVNVQALLPVSVPGGDFNPYFSTTGIITPVNFNVILQSGNNTFAVPSGAIGCVVTPPADGAVILKSKTVSGDTGVDRPQDLPWLELFDPSNAPTNFYINAASTMTEFTSVYFF